MLPLSGKTVVITRARHQADELRRHLEALGASVLVFPVIMMEPVEDPTPIYEAFQHLELYDWVVFTSTNGVVFTLSYMTQAGLDAQCFSRVKVAAIGPATADALRQSGIQIDLMPETYVGEGILEALCQAEPVLGGKRFLLPQADIAREDLPKALASAGAQVDSLSVYRTMVPPEGPELLAVTQALASHQVDVITFTSASTVTHFAQRLQAFHDLLEGVLLVSIGPITSKALLEQFGRVDVEAKTHTIPGLVDAIQTYYQNQPVARIGQ